MTRHLMIAPEFVHNAKEREKWAIMRHQAQLNSAGASTATNKAWAEANIRDAEVMLDRFDQRLAQDYAEDVVKEFDDAYNLFRALRKDMTIDWARYDDREDNQGLIWFLKWATIRERQSDKAAFDQGFIEAQGQDLYDEFLEAYTDMMEDR